MTAIAGCAEGPGDQLFPTCTQMIGGLRAYGSTPPIVRTLGNAAFGITNSLNLPAGRNAPEPLLIGERYLLVADVRLDNRKDLLAAAGGSNTGLSDAAVVGLAWERWGEACVDRLAGDFAIAVYDRAEGRLMLARDQTGQRPLFYANRGGRLAFASMPSALLECPWLETRFDFERLAGAAHGLMEASRASYFTGIRKVGPGELVVLTGDRETRRYHWNPPRNRLSLHAEEYVEAYHALLERAVAPRLDRAEGLAGLQLSSGYDSNAVAATAARLDGAPLIAFTSAPRQGFAGPVPRGRIGDESALAALTAKKLDLRHLVVRPVGSMLASLRRDARLYQDPDRNVANMQWWSAILAAAREMGVTTMLTAQMGNLTLHAGGLPVLAEWVRTGKWGRWWREARAAAALGNGRWRGILHNSFAPWIPAPLEQLMWRTFQGDPTPGSQDFLRRHRPADEEAELQLSGDLFADRLAMIRLNDTGMFRLGALAESGIEERDPTADRRLIEFSLSLPPEQLLADGVSRPLARRALAPHLPPEIIDAPLRGYQGADWFERFDQAEALALIEEISTSHAVQQLLDLVRMRAAAESWPGPDPASLASRTIYRRRFTLALSIGVFVQEYEKDIARGSSERVGVR